jgi:hypothetical protein
MGAHKDAPRGAESAHPLGYIQASDPGAVGAFRPWWVTDHDSTPTVLTDFRLRNAANSGWISLGITFAQAVASVFGRTGAVVKVAGDYLITDIGGITIVSAQSGDYLRHDGADWKNSPLQAGDLPAHNHAGENINSGTIDGARLGTHTHAAADIATGTIAQARLGTGSGGAGTKFLADDQTYKTVVASPSFAITTKSADYLATASDHTILVDASGAARVITLPAAASAPQLLLVIKKIDSSANTVTIDADGAETIDGAATQVIGIQYMSLTIQSNGTAWYIL